MVPVHVDHVLGDLGAQPIQVEVGVPGDERIEGPVCVSDAPFEQAIPLEELEPHAQAVPPGLLPYAQHVRPVAGSAGDDGPEAQHQALEPLVPEGTRHESSRLLSDALQRGRDAVGEAGAPHGSLEPHGGFELLRAAELSHPERILRPGGRGLLGRAGLVLG